jgi:RNA polymerase sigma-70 factor (ECF subfamily)
VEQLVSSEEMRLVDGLRAGEEAAFVELMRLYGASMLRVAQLYVRSRAVAEEVVQETWLAVFKGISRFEGRSSLKTWLFRILTNTAKTRAVREGRSIPFSVLAGDEEDGPSVDPDRFLGPDERFPGHWSSPPASAESGIERPSRTARVLAVLVRIRNSHVFRDERPSNRSTPVRTASHVSWTTSSATALDGT